MITGSVPTEQLPEKSHELHKHECQALVRKNVDISEQGNLDEVSTSTAVKTAQTINNIIVQLQQKNSTLAIIKQRGSAIGIL